MASPENQAQAMLDYLTAAEAGVAGAIFCLPSLAALCFLVTAAGLAVSVAAVALGAGAGVGEAAKTLAATKPEITVAKNFFI